MVRIDEITKEKAKYLKQARLGAAQLADLARVHESTAQAFASRRDWAANQSLPVLRIEEAWGCNYQIAEVIVLTDEAGSPVAALAIDDKWIHPATGPGTIYFGGKVHFF